MPSLSCYGDPLRIHGIESQGPGQASGSGKQHEEETGPCHSQLAMAPPSEIPVVPSIGRRNGGVEARELMGLTGEGDSDDTYADSLSSQSYEP